MKSTSSLLLGIACLPLLVACFDAGQIVARPAALDTSTNNISVMDSTSFFSFTVNSLEGQPIDLSQYRGKKIIVLNVASKCGYTPQYADWEKFYSANQDAFVVLGFPCNDFMRQEPGSASEIAEFCQRNYGVTFPMFEKVQVKGASKSPLYQWLTDPAQNGWNDQAPSWNFCKYLLNEQGELTHFFGSNVKPDSQEFVAAIGSW